MYCSQCGASTEPGVAECVRCHAPLGVATPPAPLAVPRERPVGVAIIAVLAIIGCAFAILGGLVLLLVGSTFGAAVGGTEGGAWGAMIGGFLSLFLFLGAAISGAVGWGLWAGHGWAWVLLLIIEGLSLASSGFTVLQGEFSAILGMIVPGIIVWYFMQPHVKRYFNIGQPAA